MLEESVEIEMFWYVRCGDRCCYLAAWVQAPVAILSLNRFTEQKRPV